MMFEIQKGNDIMGVIEKRGANSWRVGEWVVTPTGREWARRSLKYPADMSEAQQRKAAALELAKLKVDIDAGRVKPANKHSVRTFAELWMKEYVTPNTSENNRSNYQHYLDKRILPALGDVKLEKLTPLRITKFLNDLKVTPKETTALEPEKRKRKPTAAEIEQYTSKKAQLEETPEYLSGNTVYHYYQCLKTMLNKAVQWDLLAVNPMEKVDPPTYRKRKAQYLTDDQAVDLLRKIANDDRLPFRAAVQLGLTCGLRLGEVGALRLSDVDWEKGTIDISRALKYTPKKGSFEGITKSAASERLISLPPSMMELLDEVKRYEEDTSVLLGDRWRGDGYIVCDWDGSRFNHDTPSKWFHDFAAANNFPDIKFHSLRHTHATILLSSNIDAVAVATRMGHSDATTTLRTYAHAIRKRDVHAASAMQGLYDRANIPPDETAE